MKASNQTIKYYDTEARVYDKSRYLSPAGQRVDQFHKEVLSELLLNELGSDAIILEAGCGTGRLVEFVSSSAEVVGVDASLGMLEMAKVRLGDNAAGTVLLAGDLEKLPFPSASFDAGYAILVLNLIPNISLALTELARVLKPNATFVFNLPNLSSVFVPGGVYVNYRGKTVTKNSSGHRFSHWYTIKEVENAVTNAGFQVERIVSQPPFLRLSGSSQLLRSHPLSRWLSKSLYYKLKLVAS